MGLSGEGFISTAILAKARIQFVHLCEASDSDAFGVVCALGSSFRWNDDGVRSVGVSWERLIQGRIVNDAGPGVSNGSAK